MLGTTALEVFWAIKHYPWWALNKNNQISAALLTLLYILFILHCISLLLNLSLTRRISNISSGIGKHTVCCNFIFIFPCMLPQHLSMLIIYCREVNLTGSYMIVAGFFMQWFIDMHMLSCSLIISSTQKKKLWGIPKASIPLQKQNQEKFRSEFWKHP